MENSNTPLQVEILAINDNDYENLTKAINSKKYNKCIYVKLDNQENGTKFYIENNIMFAKHLDDPIQQVWPQSRIKELENRAGVVDKDQEDLKNEISEKIFNLL